MFRTGQKKLWKGWGPSLIMRVFSKWVFNSSLGFTHCALKTPYNKWCAMLQVHSSPSTTKIANLEILLLHYYFIIIIFINERWWPFPNRTHLNSASRGGSCDFGIWFCVLTVLIRVDLYIAKFLGNSVLVAWQVSYLHYLSQLRFDHLLLPAVYFFFCWTGL